MFRVADEQIVTEKKNQTPKRMRFSHEKQSQSPHHVLKDSSKCTANISCLSYKAAASLKASLKGNSRNING